MENSAREFRDAVLAKGCELNFGVNLPERCGEAAPLVVVLGFLSMKRAEMASYNEFVNAAGFPTLSAVLPFKLAVCPAEQPRRSWAASLLDFAQASGLLGGRSLVFYVIGHGGSLALQQINLLVHEEDSFKSLRERVAAVIFDSAPTPDSRLFHQMAEAYRGPLEAVMGMALKTAGKLLYFSPLGWDKKFWQDMKHLQLGHRTLYLYSFDTSRCDPERIDRLVAKRNALGAAVEWHKWPSREMWGPEYRERVVEFLRVVAREQEHPLELAFSRVARRAED